MIKEVLVQPGISGEERAHLLGGKVHANYTDEENSQIEESSQIELQTLHSNIAVVDIEAGGTQLSEEHADKNVPESILRKVVNIFIIVLLLGTLYGVVYMRQQEQQSSNINTPTNGSSYQDDNDDSSSNRPLTGHDMEGRESFNHLTNEQIGMTGLEGMHIDRMHIKLLKESPGQERASIVKYFICFVDEDYPLATATIEKNAAGQGWSAMSVRSKMQPFMQSTNATSSPDAVFNHTSLVSGFSGAAPLAPTSPGEGEEPILGSSRDDSRRNKSSRSTTPTSEHEKIEVAAHWLRTRIGMGFLEGYTTCLEVQDWYTNSYQAQFDGGDPNEAILRFLESNHDWMVRQANLHWRSSDYWLSIKGRLAQLHGLLAGIRAGCPGTHESRGMKIPILPASGSETVQEIDAHRDWIGQSLAGNDFTYHYNNPYPRLSNEGIHLASMDRTPSLIHLLILNANGDLYQIGDKFNIFADKPKKTVGRRKDNKRAENKKYMLKNHTLHDEDDDAEDDDGVTSRWGRETREIDPADYALKKKMHSSHYRRAALRGKKRQLLTFDELKQGASDDTSAGGHAYDEDLKQYFRADHCSAMIKLLANNSDVVFGHNTWDDYQNAFPRIFKTYQYPLMKNLEPAGMHRADFSSSPGLMASIDDFYIIKGSNGGNMGVMETSIDIYNRTYLEYIKHESVLAWVRVMTANELGVDGPEWADRFSEFASGTYMDQWMVIDFNKFEVGEAPSAGFLVVLEEMPGHIHWEDKTQHLIESSYWASYNNPFFTDIRDMTGQTALCIKNSLQCYSTDPRAQIFHELQKNVSSVSDLRLVMQYNHWQTDPLSMKDSCRSIACRADLEVDLTLWGPHGAVDAKVSSYVLASSPIEAHIPPVVHAKLGPTHDSQPPFCWHQFEQVTDMAGHDIMHRGHPACFEYDWLEMPRPATGI